ncbi:MAG: hypothetical protein H7Y09_01220, partial [Chitinophagaceae bacterium]|nr:hypothetical protein [Anaerolineae bacterium]
MRAKSSRGVMVGALILVALGVVLLLNNFYFLGGFNVFALSPLLLLLVGAVILLRGDILNGGGRNFGITRGSVESASLEVSAGAIDVSLRALTREGRLIAGQYAEDSRPQLIVDDAHAFLRLDRAATPFFAFADWEINLARDLPWDVYVSTSLGQADLD